ncbi:MAG: MBL fold metallo-hydrolase, partial [Gammaproteobacteria bacterium]
MQITLLGTGCPVASTLRYGPSQIVREGDTTVLVDCGSGVTQRLLSAGSAGRAVDALLLTHLHSDHVVDLFQLVVSSWHQGRDRPQQVLGPHGTRAYVDGLLELWRPELEQRIAHERRPSTAALQVETRELAEGERLIVGDLAVTVVEVDHKPVRQAFGFVFESAETPRERIVLSGDTRRCQAL